MRTRSFKSLLLGLIMVLSIAGCGNVTTSSNNSTLPNEGEILKLGVITPLTGRGAAYGEQQHDAIALAVDLINQEGGIDGKIKIEMIEEDDKTDPSVGVTVAKKLIEQEKVSVVAGSAASLVTLAFMQVNEQYKVPLVNTFAGSPKITESGYEYVWRVGFTDVYLDVETVKNLIEKKGWKTFAFLVENSDYGIPPTKAAAEKVKELGGEVVAYESYNPGETDFKAQLSKIKNLNPDVLFTHGYYTEGSIIARQVQELGIESQLVVNMGQGIPKYVELAGEASEGVIFPTFWLPDKEDERSVKFVEEFQKRYNREPGAFEAAAFETIYVIAEAVKKGGGTQPEQIQEGLKQVNGMNSLLGEIKFNEKNQNETDIKMGVFRNGKIESYF